jgi:hypothetical protein
MRRSSALPSAPGAPREARTSRAPRAAATVALTLAAAGAAVAAPAASASPTAASPRAAAPALGSTIVTISPTAADALRAPGVRLGPVGGASGSERLVGMPVKAVGPGTRPTITHAARDGFRIRVGTRSVVLRDLRVTLKGAPGISARIGRRRVAALALRSVRIRGDVGEMRSITAKARVTAAGARALRTGLRAPRLRAGVLGDVRVTLVAPPSTPAPAPAPAPPAAAPVAPAAPVATVPETVTPSLDWTIRSSWLSYLAGGNGTVTADGGATRTATGSYLLPAAGGTVDATNAGTVTHAGAVRFRQPGHGIDMEFGAFEVLLDGTQRPQVMAVFTDRNTTVGGAPIEGEPGSGIPERIVFGTLNLAEATVTREAGQYVVRRAPILLSAKAAEPFLFYKEGDAFGAMTLRAPLGS